MIDASILAQVDPHHLPLLIQTERPSVGSVVMEWVELGLFVRVVRGSKMRTLPGVFDEFSAALQFPLYFGENRDAFDECIAELDLPSDVRGVVLVIVDPGQVLVDEGSEALLWLTHSLANAAKAWAEPIEQGEWWDRPAVPFHIVLAGPRAELESAASRWHGG